VKVGDFDFLVEALSFFNPKYCATSFSLTVSGSFFMSFEEDSMTIFQKLQNDWRTSSGSLMKGDEANGLKFFILAESLKKQSLLC
jgi:hypothetical protein